MPSLESYKSGLDYSYAPGIFPSMECLTYRPEKVRRLLVHSSAAGREGAEKLCALAEARRIRIEEADKALARISGKENCYAAAVFEKFEDELKEDASHIVLHNPGDFGNVGTILRTALGLGIEDVALVRPCADVFDPKTVRASMGAMFRLRIRVYDRFEEYLEHKDDLGSLKVISGKHSGFSFLASDPDCLADGTYAPLVVPHITAEEATAADDVPPAEEYTVKAWPLTAEGYSDLLNNLEARYGQVFLVEGVVQQVLSQDPVTVIINTGEDGNFQPVVVQCPHQLSFSWEAGGRYRIYADVSSACYILPVLTARYCYVR